MTVKNIKEEMMKKIIKLMSENKNLQEGTWAIPNTSQKLNKLTRILKKGVTAKEAPDKIGDLYGDDDLFDELNDIVRSDGADSDVTQFIASHIFKEVDNFLVDDSMKNKIKKEMSKFT